MAILSGSNLKKAFCGETLFEGLSFGVFPSDKIGFVGINGAGKSTLFKIITGELEADGGEIQKDRNVRIGYLEQHPVSEGERTILDELLTVFSEVTQIEQQLEEIHLAIERGIGKTEVLVSRQAALQERFMALDGMYYRSKIKSALLGLGFSEDSFSMPLEKLSGGQRTRIELCKILLSNADLLLLDEPTNHLDIESVEWLEEFLISYKGAFIVISHDRYFLDRVSNKTFALENGHFHTYNGNYSSYIAQREIEMLTEERNYSTTVREIHRLEEVVEQQRCWKHKKNKKTHTLDNTRKAIARLESSLVEPDKAPDTMRFRFQACSGGAQRVLETEALGMGFGGKPLFEQVDLLIKKGEKVFLLGPNGCGKTTFLKTVLGIYEQTHGSCKIGENIRVGYYDQLKEHLHRDKTVINELWDEYPEMTQTEIRSALAVFLFKGDDVFKEIRSLSGGELARVELTKLLLKPVNFLIMDEPTNHLDIASREALEKALSGYDGTMLMVSHDRYFINKLADRILYLTPKGVKGYDGNYDQFLAARKESTTVLKSTPEKADERGIEYKERKRLESQKRKTLNRFATVETQIEEIEQQIKQLQQASGDPDIASDYIRLGEIEEQIGTLQSALDEALEEWTALQLTIEEMGYDREA